MNVKSSLVRFVTAFAVGLFAAFADTAEATTGSAGDYVRDGLVALWDGYENAGPGVRDARATKWVDHVGGVEIELPDWVAVEELSLYSTSGTSHVSAKLESIAHLSSTDSHWTIEIVQQSGGWKATDDYGNLQNVFATPRGTIGYRQNNAKGFYFYGPSSDTQCSLQNWVHSTAQVANLHTTAAVLGQNSKGQCSIWMDGVQGTVDYNGGYTAAKSTKFAFFGNTRMDVRVYAIRVYNRALTAKEIDKNAQLDRARFVKGGEMHVEVKGLPFNCGDVTGYGVRVMKSGSNDVFSVTSPYVDPDTGVSYACTGWALQNAAGEVIQESEAGSTSCAYTHGSEYRRLVWLWTTDAWTPTGSAIYVSNGTGNDGNTGEDWANAKKTVAAGRAKVGPGGTVYLASGRHPTTAAVTLTDGVSLVGCGAKPADVTIALTLKDTTENVIKIQDSAGTVVTNLTVTNDRGGNGSGIVLNSGLVTHCRINGCMTKNNHTDGGGVNMTGGTVRFCEISECVSKSSGGAHKSGGGVFMKGGLVENCRIRKCEAYDGRVGDGSTWGPRGGGVYMESGTLRNCLVAGCRAVTRGSGVYASPGVVENCTIVGNSAYDAASPATGLYASGKNTVLRNNIIWGNFAYDGVTAKDVLLGSDVADANVMNNTSPTKMAKGSDNSDVPPVFVDGDYRLDYCAAVGTGYVTDDMANLVDLDGKPRTVGGKVDRGCYQRDVASVLECAIAELEKGETQDHAAVRMVGMCSEPDTEAVYTWTLTRKADGAVVSQTGKEFNRADLPTGVWDVLLSVTNGAHSAEKLYAGAVEVKASKVYVNVNGNNVYPYATLEDGAYAIDVAFPLLGETGTMYVAEGVYTITNQLNLIAGNGSRLIGLGEPENTVICQANHANFKSNGYRSVKVEKGETLISGLTFVGGMSDDNPDGTKFETYGLLYSSANVLVTNCVFRDSKASYGQNTAAITMSAGRMVDCLLSNLSAAMSGGGTTPGGAINLTGGTIERVRVIGCSTDGNTTAGDDSMCAVVLLKGSGAVLRNSLVARCYGTQTAPVSLLEGAQLINCTVVANTNTLNTAVQYNKTTPVPRTQHCGGVRVVAGTVANCVLADNWSKYAGCVSNLTGSATYTLVNDRDDAFATAENHNLIGDPMFEDAAGGDYRLAWNSPAITAGSNAALGTDAAVAAMKDLAGTNRLNGALVDLGCFESAFYDRYVALEEVTGTGAGYGGFNAPINGAQKVPDGDVLVHEYVPAFDKMTQKFGLFDMVTGEFHESDTATPFTGTKPNPHLTLVWIGGAEGDWDDPANWSAEEDPYWCGWPNTNQRDVKFTNGTYIVKLNSDLSTQFGNYLDEPGADVTFVQTYDKDEFRSIYTRSYQDVTLNGRMTIKAEQNNGIPLCFGYYGDPLIRGELVLEDIHKNHKCNNSGLTTGYGYFYDAAEAAIVFTNSYFSRGGAGDVSFTNAESERPVRLEFVDSEIIMSGRGLNPLGKRATVTYERSHVTLGIDATSYNGTTVIDDSVVGYGLTAVDSETASGTLTITNLVVKGETTKFGVEGDMSAGSGEWLFVMPARGFSNDADVIAGSHTNASGDVTDLYSQNVAYSGVAPVAIDGSLDLTGATLTVDASAITENIGHYPLVRVGADGEITGFSAGGTASGVPDGFVGSVELTSDGKGIDLVVRKELSSEDIACDYGTYTKFWYSGKKGTYPSLTITDGAMVLELGKDYTITNWDGTTAKSIDSVLGRAQYDIQYQMVIYGCGDYAGSREVVSFSVVRQQLTWDETCGTGGVGKWTDRWIYPDDVDLIGNVGDLPKYPTSGSIAVFKPSAGATIDIDISRSANTALGTKDPDPAIRAFEVLGAGTTILRNGSLLMGYESAVSAAGATLNLVNAAIQHGGGGGDFKISLDAARSRLVLDGDCDFEYSGRHSTIGHLGNGNNVSFVFRDGRTAVYRNYWNTGNNRDIHFDLTNATVFISGLPLGDNRGHFDFTLGETNGAHAAEQPAMLTVTNVFSLASGSTAKIDATAKGLGTYDIATLPVAFDLADPMNAAFAPTTLVANTTCAAGYLPQIAVVTNSSVQTQTIQLDVKRDIAAVTWAAPATNFWYTGKTGTYPALVGRAQDGTELVKGMDYTVKFIGPARSNVGTATYYESSVLRPNEVGSHNPKRYDYVVTGIGNFSGVATGTVFKVVQQELQWTNESGNQAVGDWSVGPWIKNEGENMGNDGAREDFPTNIVDVVLSPDAGTVASVTLGGTAENPRVVDKIGVAEGRTAWLRDGFLMLDSSQYNYAQASGAGATGSTMAFSNVTLTASNLTDLYTYGKDSKLVFAGENTLSGNVKPTFSAALANKTMRFENGRTKIEGPIGFSSCGNTTATLGIENAHVSATKLAPGDAIHGDAAKLNFNFKLGDRNVSNSSETEFAPMLAVANTFALGTGCATSAKIDATAKTVAGTYDILTVPAEFDLNSRDKNGNTPFAPETLLGNTTAADGFVKSINVVTNGGLQTVQLVLKRDLSALTILAPDVEYAKDGSARTPVVVKDGTKTLVEGTHYSIVYSNNTGLELETVTATAEITGLKDYAGVVTTNFLVMGRLFTWVGPDYGDWGDSNNWYRVGVGTGTMNGWPGHDGESNWAGYDTAKFESGACIVTIPMQYNKPIKRLVDEVDSVITFLTTDRDGKITTWRSITAAGTADRPQSYKGTIRLVSETGTRGYCLGANYGLPTIENTLYVTNSTDGLPASGAIAFGAANAKMIFEDSRFHQAKGAAGYVSLNNDVADRPVVLALTNTVWESQYSASNALGRAATVTISHSDIRMGMVADRFGGDFTIDDSIAAFNNVGPEKDYYGDTVNVDNLTVSGDSTKFVLSGNCTANGEWHFVMPAGGFTNDIDHLTNTQVHTAYKSVQVVDLDVAYSGVAPVAIGKSLDLSAATLTVEATAITEVGRYPLVRVGTSGTVGTIGTTEVTVADPWMTYGHVEPAEEGVGLDLVVEARIELSEVTAANQTYASAVLTPDLVFKKAGGDLLDGLVEGVDYAVAWTNAAGVGVSRDDLVAAGTYTATVTGLGRYKGTVPCTFTIDRKVLTIEGLEAVSRPWDNTSLFDLTGTAVLAGVEGDDDVALDMTELPQRGHSWGRSKDDVWSDGNQRWAGDRTVYLDYGSTEPPDMVIALTGDTAANYVATAALMHATISLASITNLTLTPLTSSEYNGQFQGGNITNYTQTFIVANGAKLTIKNPGGRFHYKFYRDEGLTSETDDLTSAGTIWVMAEANVPNDSVQGYAVATYTIAPRSLENCTITVTEFVEQGKDPTVTVIDTILDGVTLVKGVDYDVTCDTSTPGSTTVTITGKGNYIGTVSRSISVMGNVYTWVGDADGNGAWDDPDCWDREGAGIGHGWPGDDDELDHGKDTVVFTGGTFHVSLENLATNYSGYVALLDYQDQADTVLFVDLPESASAPKLTKIIFNATTQVHVNGELKIGGRAGSKRDQTPFSLGGSSSFDVDKPCGGFPIIDGSLILTNAVQCPYGSAIAFGGTDPRFVVLGSNLKQSPWWGGGNPPVTEFLSMYTTNEKVHVHFAMTNSSWITMCGSNAVNTLGRNATFDYSGSVHLTGIAPKYFGGDFTIDDSLVGYQFISNSVARMYGHLDGEGALMHVKTLSIRGEQSKFAVSGDEKIEGSVVMVMPENGFLNTTNRFEYNDGSKNTPLLIDTSFSTNAPIAVGGTLDLRYGVFDVDATAMNEVPVGDYPLAAAKEGFKMPEAGLEQLTMQIKEPSNRHYRASLVTNVTDDATILALRLEWAYPTYSFGDEPPRIVIEDDWVEAATGVKPSVETYAAISNSLLTANAFGLNKWQAYVAGFAANEVNTANGCIVAIPDKSTTSQRISFGNWPAQSRTNETSGMRFRLEESTQSDTGFVPVAVTNAPVFDVALPGSAETTKYYRIQIEFRPRELKWFWFKALEDSSVKYLPTHRNWSSKSGYPVPADPSGIHLEYTLDYGMTWQPFIVGETRVELEKDEAVLMRAPAGEQTVSLANYNPQMSGALEVGGDLMSLISQDRPLTVPSTFCFSRWLQSYKEDNSAAVTSPQDTNSIENLVFAHRLKLPAIELTAGCYAFFIADHNNLRDIPLVFPGRVAYGETYRGVVCSNKSMTEPIRFLVVKASGYRVFDTLCQFYPTGAKVTIEMPFLREIAAGTEQAFTSMFGQGGDAYADCRWEVGFTSYPNNSLGSTLFGNAASTGVVVCPKALLDYSVGGKTFKEAYMNSDWTTQTWEDDYPDEEL